MADDPKEAGPADRTRINVEQPHELSYWSKKFGVAADKLRATVEKVGPMVEKVRADLRK